MNQPLKNTRGKQRQEQVRQILIKRDFDELDNWARADNNPLRTMTSLLFEEDLTIIWRVIEAMGKVARIVADRDLEKVRKLIRRLFWLMNDESGGLCRRGPEAIGEILVNVPELIPEYVLLLPMYLWEEPFEQGTRFAIYRLIMQKRFTSETFKGCIGDLLKSLEHEDEVIRGFSYLILNEINKSGKLKIDIPKFQKAIILLYNFNTGEVESISLGV